MTEAERILQDTVRENAMKELAKHITEWMLEKGLFRTCVNCEYWIEGPPENRQQICGKFQARPPTKIIVCGCEYHSDNIPF